MEAKLNTKKDMELKYVPKKKNNGLLYVILFVLSIVSNETFNISIFKKIIGIFIQYRGTQFSTDGWFLIVCLAMI